MKKRLLILSGIIGLGIFSQSAVAGCYCPSGQWHGNSCVVPRPNGSLALDSPICTPDVIPEQNRPLTLEDMQMLGNGRDFALSFSPKTGDYGLVVHNMVEEERQGRYYSQDDLKALAHLECVAKENNETSVNLAKKANKKLAKDLLKNSSCQVQPLQPYLYNQLSLWRGQKSNGNWVMYFLQYNANAYPQQQMDDLVSRCQKETKQCIKIGVFGNKTGIF